MGSIAAATMVIRSVARDYLPPEFQDYLYLNLRSFINKFSTHLTMVFYESEGFNDNEIYNAAQLYLSARITPDIHRLKVSKIPHQKDVAIEMETNEEFIDTFNGVKLYWSTVSKKTPVREYSNDGDGNYSVRSDLRSLELTFHGDHKDMVLNDYLPHIIKHVEKIKREKKNLKLFTVNMSNLYSSKRSTWTSVNLDHPANFATLAMDTGIKEKVMKDLDRFVERREYYRKVGKAWKRGYLLYGPPGTGKSSLIAAMANYLNFDIYDLELTDVKSNSELRTLLVATANRSILVVEGIDCSEELHDRVAVEAAQMMKKKDDSQKNKPLKRVTLSGFLNFVDGLWSSCGDERIIIFTTNHKDKLDPALLRPGRMDVHIHMSYCTPCGFRLLASNYLGITQHDLYDQIEDLIVKINVTPAEVAEQLLKDDDPDIVLEGLVKFFDVKKVENEEEIAKVEMNKKRIEIEEEKIRKKGEKESNGQI
ncbi:AAA-ATPase At3g50940-like [Rutidosis leptorrhynchoides]|uniref:AAA-ATPase At3g50940-like n=1 Tax=Rutidosis leptorrhynchoides TaxID=125765 RepID=UPI003A98DEB8